MRYKQGVRKNCIICEKEIHNKGTPKGVREKRAWFCITCSKDCARVYRRVQNYVFTQTINRLKKEEKLI